MLLTSQEQRHLEEVISTYRGDGEVLQNALGALLIGKVYGWRVLRVMYSNTSYSLYQKKLKLEFREWCEPETKFSERHRVFKLLKSAGRFWDNLKKKFAVSHEENVSLKDFS